MIKTKIKFADIVAGDLIEVINVSDGVKRVETGIAFTKEPDYISGYAAWLTSEMGLLTLDGDVNDSLSRIDVAEVTFEDIRKGDLIRVTSTVGDTEQVVTGKAAHLVTADGDWWDSWDTDKGVKLCVRLSSANVKIEVLERGA